MLKIIIDQLNLNLQLLGFFNTVHCLADKIEREDRIYPGVYNGSGEYVQIKLDVNGSLSYWRKIGDITMSEEPNNQLGCTIQYKTVVPLKLVGFMRKDVPYNDQYFSDNICGEIIGNLTNNSALLKKSLKAKSVSILATKYNTDWRAVSTEEYDKVDFEARYTHAYFSIDFNVTLVTNSNCFYTMCNG